MPLHARFSRSAGDGPVSRRLRFLTTWKHEVLSEGEVEQRRQRGGPDLRIRSTAVLERWRFQVQAVGIQAGNREGTAPTRGLRAACLRGSSSDPGQGEGLCRRCRDLFHATKSRVVGTLLSEQGRGELRLDSLPVSRAKKCGGRQ